MSWAICGLFFLFGILLGYGFSWLRMSNRMALNEPTAQELTKVQAELDQHQQNTAQYLNHSFVIMQRMANDIEQAQQLWNESARELLSEHQPDDHLLPVNTEIKVDSSDDAPPNDYVQGSHGIMGKFEPSSVISSVPQPTDDNDDEQPNDYARGSHGIIGNQKKVANE